MTIIKIIIDTRNLAGVVSAPVASKVAADASPVTTLEKEDEGTMAKRVLIAGGVRNKRQGQQGQAGDAVIVQVQLTGEEKDRFLAYKERAEFSPSNAEVGRKLMLERLAQIETAAPAA